MEHIYKSDAIEGLNEHEIRNALEESLAGLNLKKVLIVPPDFTRFHSNAGLITNVYYHLLQNAGVVVDILPALGTHVPLSKEEAALMFGDIPYEHFFEHKWRSEVIKIGEIPGDYISSITDGIWNESIDVELNRMVMDSSYDLILSIGQVVPHEVIGMANHSKNLFVGVGGSDMINKSHMIGAVYGMERMMGKDHTPVRQIFDFALSKYLSERPVMFVLTVNTAPGGKTRTHGLFIGNNRKILEEAIVLSQQMNIDFVDHGIDKCVVYLDPTEFRSTWLGNKAVYRTRMAMADNGHLIILAPGVDKFGEDDQVDYLIRKYGYRGRLQVLDYFNNNDDLRANMSAAAHLIHGSSDDRFKITYAVKHISKKEIEGVNYSAADFDELIKRYDPASLKPGYNKLRDGEEIFFISNPALGLWINSQNFYDD